jgi:hypothetical protein
MRRFCLGLLVGVGLAAMGVVGLVYYQLGTPNPLSISLGGIVAYKKKIAHEAKGSGAKILICAGSSGLYGLRGDVVERHTGQRTINLAANAALGMMTFCEWVQGMAEPGDTVLLAFEYELYDWIDVNWDSRRESDRVVRFNINYVDYVLAYEPTLFRAMTWEKVKFFLSLPNRRLFEGVYQTALRSVKGKRSDLLDQAAGLNRNGDLDNVRVEQRPASAGLGDRAKVLTLGLTPQPQGFAYLSAFLTWCREHQVKVVATWPNLLRQPEYDEPIARRSIERITEFFTQNGVPILGTYQEALLPEEQFFDTIYHLVEDAAIARTERLMGHWKIENAPAL